MQKHLQKCLWLLCLWVSTAMFAQTGVLEPTKGVLRVKLQPEVATQIGIAPVSTRSGIVATGIEPFDVASRKVKAMKMERVFPYVEKMEAKARKHGLHLWYEIRFDENVNPREAAQIFKSVPGITIAENIVPMELIGNNEFALVSPEEILEASTRSSAMPFNDPLLSRQWHYNNDGSMSGSVAGADANVFEAWKIATGNKDLIVAIIDGGIDYSHPDLAENICINEAELNGLPGTDNDNNGYVGDIYGFNFVLNTGDISAHNHGTHVAGTVGAVNNNGIGLAGIAGGNGQGGVKLLSCQVFDSRSNLQADFAKAFYYAAVRGAALAQCSWGWSVSGYYEQAVVDAIKFYTAEAESDFMKGGLAIFANGNTGSEGNFYPACMEEVVAVGSMTIDLQPAPYSSYGDWVDVTAPGGLMTYNSGHGVYSTLPNGQYGYSEGTSMACPHVSGIAALVLSKYGNPNFPNETLRQQLITSVNDFYTRNPGVEGKFGSGYIDAWKALQMGNGTAPQPVSDFIMTPGQDNIYVEWTIPASEDNNVNYHLIYYSLSPFTADNLNGIPQKRVDTKFYSTGDLVGYEVEDLLPMTTYYMAIKAVDRWGNAAEISPVKSATTNAGPKLELDKTQLSISVNAAQSNSGNDNFVISNVDQGLLKWEVAVNTVSAKASAYSTTSAGIKPGNVAPYNGKASVIPSSVDYPVISADYFADDYPEEISYYKTLAAYLGESDLTLTNSCAQWFHIDPYVYTNGFNLTDLRFENFNSANPIIEIYDGNITICPEGLLMTVDYSYFSGNNDIALQEQLFFEPGSAFWVVAHFPSGQTNPLTAGLLEEEYRSSYSYYSSNMGQSWTLLSEVLRGGNLEGMADQIGWTIIAKSKNPDWSKVLAINPTSGSVQPNASQEVVVANDGQNLVNGNYKFKLTLSTNEGSNSTHYLPATMTVTGNEPDLKTAKVVDFGDLLIGQSKTLRIEVINNGYAPFVGNTWGGLGAQNFSCTSDQFELPSYYAGGFPARATSYVDISFEPTIAGSHSGTVTFSDMNGNTHSFVLRGIADEPAKIEINPTVVELGDLMVDDEARDVQFTISNTGKYPLEYVFPKFSDDIVETTGQTSHKFGYTYVSNLNLSDGFAYDNNPELINSVNINDQFGDYDYWSEPIPLGFSFPYYGKEYESVYITTFGAVAMENNGAIHTCIPPSATSTCVGGYGLITMYGFNNLLLAPDSKIDYAYQDGKFYVKYTNVLALVQFGEYTPVSFHMSLSPNGDIEFFYDDIYPYMLFQGGQNIFVAITDIAVQDPMVITDSYRNEAQLHYNIMPGTAIKINAPGKMMVQEISAPSGVIGIGESKEITAKVQATEGMYAGDLHNSLVVISNDPSQSVAYVNFKANITGETLKPVAELSSDEFDFGTVFKTSEAKAAIQVKNSGTNLLTISEITLDSDAFASLATLPLEIEPGTSKDIMVSMNTAVEAVLEGEIKISTEDGALLTAKLNGIVIGAPEISLTPAEITATVESGAMLKRNLKILNGGNETLEYTIVPKNTFTFDNLNADENSSFSYIYSASVNDSSVEYNWEDIETNGEGEQLKFAYWLYHDYVEVQLPYEITYYGEKYDKIYIYGVGFVSFNHINDYNEAPAPPTAIPSTETLYTNFIAPYWGNHFMDQTSTGGVFYTVKDDRVVISFMEYANSVNYSVCYQLIMYRNGIIKFQYKLADETYGYWNGIYGMAGLQNNAGDEGVQIPQRCMTLNSAIEFYPVKSGKVTPSSMANVAITMDTDLMAGNYESAIEVKTNVPTSPTVEIPVNLTITGEPNAVFPEEVACEAVTGTTSGTGYLEIPFEIKNTGTAPFEITNVDADGLIGYEATIGMLFYWGTYFDDWTWSERVGWARYVPGTVLTVGKEPLKLKVMVMDNYTVADYDVPMVFSVEGLTESSVTVPFKLSITEAPYLMFASPEIRISGVSDDYKEQLEIMFGNIGSYKLNYSIELDPSGVGAEDATDSGDNGGVMPMSANEPSVMSTQVSESVHEVELSKTKSTRNDTAEETPDLPSSISYNRALYHPILPGSNQLYIIGSFDKYTQFRGATQFTAPADGFNLNSFYTYLTIGDMINAEVILDIIQGDDLVNGQIIATSKLVIEKEEPAGSDINGDPVYRGAYALFTFDKDIYMNPNETFYARITYPVGYEYSAGMIRKEENVIPYRYMYSIGDSEWYDAAMDLEASYGSIGYLATCLEMVEGDTWIKLLTPETSGSIEPYEIAAVTVEVNAAAARMDRNNKAVLVVRSNDPLQPVVNYPIYLDKNTAPVVTVPSNIYVKEAEASLVTLNVTDEDADSFEVKFEDALGVVKIDSFEAVDGSDISIQQIDENTLQVTSYDNWTPSSLNITFAITPEYGHAGVRNFNVTASDAKNNASITAVTYYVEHVNRAPVAVEVDDIMLALNTATMAIEFADMFNDPDGDKLRYSLSLSETGIVEVFSSDESVILLGKRIGETTVTVRAIDTSGAYTDNSFNVNVSSGTGIGSTTIDGAVTVYPNPVVDYANVTINADINGEVTYKVYNTAGSLMFAETAKRATAEIHMIDMSSYAAGIYYLEIEVDGVKTTTSVVKK